MPPSVASPAPGADVDAEGSQPATADGACSLPLAPASTSTGNDLLDLFLRTNNDAPRLDSSVWDLLALRDLYQLRSVSKSAYSALELVEYDRCRDGKDYLVPFPAYPGVLSTNSDIKVGSGLFTHQLASLRAMHKAENDNTTFGALRGGVLGDAPGLGKTITMLSLIANTSALRPVEPKEFYDNESVDEHWKLMRTNPVFRVEILRALKPFRSSGLYLQLAEDVSPPYKDDRFPTLKSFEQYVNRAMRPVAPQSQLDLFRRSVIAFKAGLDKRNRRFFSNDRGKRMIFERNLIPCSTTLIIVPDALLEHWAEQIRRHINLRQFVDPNSGGGSSGVVYIDGVGDLSTARFPLNHQKMSVPSAFDLMGFMIVVVPFSRINQQYSNMRKRRREEEVVDLTDDSQDHESSSPLLQLRWFRIIVDEGHELGENEAGSDVTNFINQIGAERRWVMSGTPTTGDEDSKDFTAKGLDQLQRLLFFLRHEKYGTKPEMAEDDERNNYRKARGGREKSNKEVAKSAWVTCVKKPFMKRHDEGRKELYRVLGEIMVMHKKEDLSLPKPIFKQSQVNVPVPSDVQSAIIDAVFSEDSDKTDLLNKIGIPADRKHRLRSAFDAGGMALFNALFSEYMGTDDFQVLVDEAQANFIVDGVKKERLELEARGGAIHTGVTAPLTAADICMETWVDRRPVKAVVYSDSHNNLLSVAEYLYESFGTENIAELIQGKIEHMSYELGRFRHNFKEGKNCPICGGWNEYTGKKLTSCTNRLLEVTDGETTFLIEPERIIRAVGQVEYNSSDDMATRRLGNPVEMTRLQGAPLTKYGLSQKHWRIGDVLCVDARDSHPLLRKRWSEETWELYGSERCLELMEEDDYEGRDNFLGPLPYGSDVMAGREVMVKLLKWQPCGRFHSKPRWDARRKKQVGYYLGPTLDNVEMKTQKEDTFILLLDASLSFGLDLSFVTHLFLLEPIDDAALLEQVTARAHRLGATGPATIETINVWQQTDSNTKEVAKQFKSSVQNDTSDRTSTAVCEHCYRSFANIELAESHELTCDRNPDGNAIIDPYHLSAVYRDIRPPAPMVIGAPRNTNSAGDDTEGSL